MWLDACCPSIDQYLIPVTGQPLPLVSRGGTSTVISCAYIGIILSVSRFGANMGNEEEEEEPAADENPVGIEPDTDGHPIESGLASVENVDSDINPLEAVAELKEETTTEKNI